MMGYQLLTAPKNYSSWSVRPWLVMRHFDIPFEEVVAPLFAEEGAKELFHDIVVEKSRSIYEGLVDEDQVEEAAETEVEESEAVEEDSDEVVEESDFDEELGGNAAEEMIDDIDADEEGLSMEDDEGEEELEDRVVDIEDALDELKAEFEALMAGDDDDAGDDAMDMDMDMDMGDEEEGEEEEEMESVEEAEEVVREYAEKAPAPVTAEEGDGSAGPVAGKNDMGGKAVDPTGEESGGATPKSEDMGMTTEPDMKKV